jgi:hypothetical protein
MRQPEADVVAVKALAVPREPDRSELQLSPTFRRGEPWHLVAATPNARFVEYFPDDRVFNFSRLIDTRLTVTADGELRVPAGPGLGFRFDPSALDSCARDDWS